MSEFAESLHHHRKSLLRYATQHLRNIEDAEDSVQNVYVACMQYPDAVREADSVGAYLMQMLKHEIARLIEQNERDSFIVGVAISQPLLTLPETTLIEKELANRINTALAAIAPKHHRSAGILYWRHHLDYQEVADSMGVTYAQAVSYVRQATTKLRRILSNTED